MSARCPSTPWSTQMAVMSRRRSWEKLTRGRRSRASQNGLADDLLLPLPAGGKTFGVGLEGQAALHHGHAGVEIVEARHFDA